MGDSSAPQTCAELEPQFIAEDDLPFELCRTSEEALDHPQIVANGEVVEVDDPVVGHGARGGSGSRRSHACPSVIARSAPALGAASAGEFAPAERPDGDGRPRSTRCRA